MTNILILNMHIKNKTKVSIRIESNLIKKRTMFKQATSSIMHNVGTKLIPSQKNITINRNYVPGKGYIAHNVTNNVVGKDSKTGHKIYDNNVVTATGKSLPLHENSHTIVRDNETGLDVGVLTSAKDPQKGNINIANENYKGEQKMQQFRAFSVPRFYNDEVSTIRKNSNATTFLEKYNNEIDDAVKKSNNYTKPALARVNKDSPQLYHENGLPIFDKDGKEIDYD